METNDDESGVIHHVVGDLGTGMTYEQRPGLQSEIDPMFYAKQLIGRVKASKAADIGKLCPQQPGPRIQKNFIKMTMNTELLKPDGSFYQTAEPRARLFKCIEWTVERAIPALQSARIFE